MPTSRYANFRTVYDSKTKKSRLETFPPITAEQVQSSSDVIIELDQAQRIDAIAAQYLGDGRYWWCICLLNDLTFPFGKNLKAGTIFRIPSNIDRFVNAIQRRTT